MIKMKNGEGGDETTQVDQSPDKDKEKSPKKARKGKLFDKETVSADLDVGLDIEAKFFDPVDASQNLDNYETLTNEDVQKLIELHKQTNKKKLVLRVTKKTIKLSFVDESVQDIEIPHAEIPRLWAPSHRGKLVLSISRRVDSKFRIYFVQLEKSKGETFLLKLQLSYKEYLVEGSSDSKTGDEKAAGLSLKIEGTSEETETDAEPSKSDKETSDKISQDEAPVTENQATTTTTSNNLLDLDTEADTNSASDINFDSLLISTDNTTNTTSQVASDQKKAIVDLFATNGTSAPSNSSWANFDSNVAQEMVKPTNKPSAALSPVALAPPPGRNSPSNQRRSASPQTPMVAASSDITALNRGSPVQMTTSPFTSVFTPNNLLVQPPSASPRSASPAFSNNSPMFPNVAPTNPFIQPTQGAYGGAFEVNSMEAAFQELRNPPTVNPSSVAPVSMLQPQVVSNTSMSDNPFDTPEPQIPEISSVEKKTAFGDLLDEFGFKPQTSQMATPKEMFAARDRKEKGPSLNDLGRN